MIELSIFTGYSFVVNNGILEIDFDRGIQKDFANPKMQMGSRKARKELRAAIEDKEIYYIKNSTNDDLTPNTDYEKRQIGLSLPFVKKLLENSKNLDLINFGMASTFFHELSHLMRGKRDPVRNNYHRGGAVRAENKILKQLGLASRRSYGIKFGDGIYIPYDWQAKRALKRRQLPPPNSKYAVFRLDSPSSRSID